MNDCWLISSRFRQSSLQVLIMHHQSHGSKHGRGWGTSPTKFGVGMLMQIVPHILSDFEISSIRLLASQCSKKLTNPITLAAYYYFTNVHQITTLGGKFNIFGEDTEKNSAENSRKHAISSEKNVFFSSKIDRRSLSESLFRYFTISHSHSILYLFKYS